MMKKLIYTMLFTLAGLAGMAQTNEPLPSGAVPFGATTYLSPLDSTIWLYKERDGTAIKVANWVDVDSLFKLGYTKGQVDSAIASRTPIVTTRLEMLAMISDTKLLPGNTYLFEATSENVPIIVTAESTSSLSKKIAIVGDDFSWVDYDINADVIEAFDVISCAIRNIAGVWGIIDDVDHTPIGVGSVTQDDVNNWFNMIYSRTDYNEVVSMTYSVDETYARNLYWIGASVGTTYSRFELYINQCYAFLRGDVGFVSNSANSKGIASTSWNSSTGTLTITTWPYTGLDVSATSGHPDYRCIVTGVSGNNISIQFVNNSGVVETTATNRTIVYFSRNGSRRVENINANEPSSNIWVYGVMKKRIE